MPQIALIFSTEDKTLRLIKDGETLSEPHYVSFEYTGMDTEDGRYTYYMTGIHVEEMDGMKVTTTVNAEHEKCKGLTGDKLAECKKKYSGEKQ